MKSNGRHPKDSEEKKLLHFQIRCIYWTVIIFPPFIYNQRFRGFFPPSSEFQRVNEGNKQGASFFSPPAVFEIEKRGKKFIFNASVKKRQISNTAGGEKKEVSCLFPSLTLWNTEEGGKKPLKRWFSKKGKKRMTVQ